MQVVPLPFHLEPDQQQVQTGPPVEDAVRQAAQETGDIISFIIYHVIIYHVLQSVCVSTRLAWCFIWKQIRIELQ